MMTPVSRWFQAGLLVLTAAATVGCVPQEGKIRHLRYTVWGQVRQVAIEQNIAAAFEQAHPDVKVDVITVTADYQSKVQSMIVGGVIPDVMMVDELSYADWGSRGALMDLTDLVTELNQEGPFMPAVMEALSVHGRYYAVPVNVHGLVMYCNLDALKRGGVAYPLKPNLTWEEFVALGPSLAAKGGATRSSTDYLCAAPPSSLVLLGSGAHLFDDPHHPSRVTVESAPAVRAIELLRLMDRNHWAPSASSQMDSGAFQLFRDGKAAFLFMWRSISPELMGHTPFAWDVAPVPIDGDGEDRLGGTFIGVGKSTAEPELAREFARFYASQTAVALAVDGGRVVPVRRAWAYGKNFLSQPGPPSMAVFSDTMEAHRSGYLLYGPGIRDVYDLCHWREQQALAEPEVPAADIVHFLQSDLENWLAGARKKGTL